MPRQNIIKSSVHCLLFLTLFLIGFPVASIQAQEKTTPSESQPTESTTPSNTSAASASSIFSIEGGDKLMVEADQAIDAQEYDLAAQKLQSARQVFNQLSNFYLQLFNSTTKLDNAAAESHRQKALETSIKRDEATYQLALVHRSQDKSELSIPLLVQIVTSQSPGIGLGKKAYDQLLEIGFVDVPITIPKQRGTSLQNPPQNQQNSAPATPQSPSTSPPTSPPPENPDVPAPTPEPSLPNP